MNTTAFQAHIDAIIAHLQAVEAADAGLESSVSGILDHVAGILRGLKMEKEARLSESVQRLSQLDAALFVIRELEIERNEWAMNWLEIARVAGGVH